MNHFSQLFNTHGVNDVRQTEIHTAVPLAPEPSTFEIELATEKLKSHKSPGIDQIPTELIKAGGITIWYEVHKLIIAIWTKEELPEESIFVPIYKKGDKTDCSNYRSRSLWQLCTIFYLTLLSWLTPYAEENTGDHQRGF